MPTERLQFADSQIGKGLRPLAQHGTVVIDEGVITLYGTQGDVIDTAPLTKTTAKRSWITGGQTVIVVLDGRKYNTTPGWGAIAGTGALNGFQSFTAPKALVKAVAAANATV